MPLQHHVDSGNYGYSEREGNEVLIVPGGGKTGTVVNPYNTSMLAQAILEFLLNPTKAHAYGEAGYARVKEYFSLERYAQTTLAAYSRVRGDPRNRSGSPGGFRARWPQHDSDPIDRRTDPVQRWR